MKNAMKRQLGLILTVLLLTTLACGQLEVGIETPAPLPPEAPADVQSEPTQDNQGSQVRDDTQPEAPAVDGSQYWEIRGDHRTGVRFAVPCFWEFNLTQEETQLSSFSIHNFTQDWVQSFGGKRGAMIWDFGAVKIDIGYWQMSDYGLPNDASLEQLAQAIFGGDDPNPESWIVSTEPYEANGQTGLRVNMESATWGPSSLFLFQVEPGLVMMFASGYLDHPDIMNILNSIALTDPVQVNVPMAVPAAPPEGMAAECLGDVYDPSEGPAFANIVPCDTPNLLTGPEEVSCNVMDGLRSGNTQALGSWAAPEFILGFWRSEGQTLTPEEVGIQMMNYLPADPNALTFTTNTDLFPTLSGGVEPYQLVNPDWQIVMIVYAQGLGPDGTGGAFLYFVGIDGEYRWAGMVYSFDNFAN